MSRAMIARIERIERLQRRKTHSLPPILVRVHPDEIASPIVGMSIPGRLPIQALPDEDLADFTNRASAHFGSRFVFATSA